MLANLSRNQKIIAGIGAGVIVVLIGLLLAVALGKPKNTSSSSGSESSPTPSSTISLLPDETPSPLASPSASAAGGGPSPSASSAPAATPVVEGPAIGTQGHVLQASSGSDPAGGRLPSGGGCGTLGDAGFTVDSCGIVLVDGNDQAHSVAYVVEHNGGGTKRVYLMTARSGANWHTELYREDSGGQFGTITVDGNHPDGYDLTHDGKPEITVGFRVVGTAHTLSYDVVSGVFGHPLAILMHRDAVHGSVTLQNGGIIEYAETQPGVDKMSAINYTDGAFRVVGQDNASPPFPPGDYP